MRKRRILSLLLAVAVTATMLIAVPLTASAADNQWDAATDNTNKWVVDGSSETNGSLTVEVLPAKCLNKAKTGWGDGSDTTDNKLGAWTYEAAKTSGSSQHPAYGTANDNMRPEDYSKSASTTNLPAYNCLKVSVKEKGTLTFNIKFGTKAISVIKAAEEASNGEYVSGRYADNDAEFNNSSATGTNEFSDLSFEAEPGYYYYVGSTGTKAQYSTITFAPAETEPKDWTNNTGDEAATVTGDNEQGYTLSYAAGLDNHDGFSYELTDKIADLPPESTLSSLENGVITVSFDIQRPAETLTQSNYFVTLSGGTTMPDWSNTDKNTYGVLSGYTSYQEAYLYGGKNHKPQTGKVGIFTTTNEDDQTKWVSVSFEIDLKTNIFTGTRAGDKSGLFNIDGVEKTDKLYLNVNPSDKTNNDGAQTIMIKNIKAEYKTPSYTDGEIFGNYSTDSGIYTSGDVQYAVIRYFQEYKNTEGISNYGFYFVDSNGVVFANKEYVIEGSEAFNIESNDGFYGDLKAIDKNDWDKTFYAKAYVVINDVPYFSENIPGKVNKDKTLTDYNE